MFQDYLNRALSVDRGGIVRSFPMGETTGTTAKDKSGLGRDLTYAGITLANAPGFDGRPSPLFPGVSSGIIETTNLTDYSVTAGAILVAFKMYNASVWIDGLQRTMVSLRIDSNNYISIMKNTTDNQLRIRYKGQGNNNTSVYTISDTGWNVLLFTWRNGGTEYVLYLNGINISAFTGTPTVMSGAFTEMTIGKYPGQSLRHYGWLDFVQIWANSDVTSAHARILGRL